MGKEEESLRIHAPIWGMSALFQCRLARPVIQGERPDQGGLGGDQPLTMPASASGDRVTRRAHSAGRQRPDKCAPAEVAARDFLANSHD
ncbi:hypothetical protein D9M69_283560 [compost metagenome]